MASTSSGSALEILADRRLFETHFGISYADAPLDSNESDLELEMCEDWGDDDENWSTDRFAGKYKYKYRRTIICKLHSKSACAQMATTWVSSQMEDTPPHMLTVCMEVNYDTYSAQWNVIPSSAS